MTMREIMLMYGEITLVDDEDYDRWGHLPWRFQNDYVVCYWEGQDLRLHREIMQCPAGMEVHHIDFDPLNNQRSNLEVLTKAGHRSRHRKENTPRKRKKPRSDDWLIRYHHHLPPVDWHAIDRDYTKRGL